VSAAPGIGPGLWLESLSMPGRTPRIDRCPKACAACGREIEWRKKWERDWANIRYCSKSCRSRGVTEIDTALESAILTLLGSRARGATICPSEAARLVDADGWRGLMEPSRRAARRLVGRGRVVITRQGRVVDPSSARGAVRVRLA